MFGSMLLAFTVAAAQQRDGTASTGDSTNVLKSIVSLYEDNFHKFVQGRIDFILVDGKARNAAEARSGLLTETGTAEGVTSDGCCSSGSPPSGLHLLPSQVNSLRANLANNRSPLCNSTSTV